MKTAAEQRSICWLMVVSSVRSKKLKRRSHRATVATASWFDRVRSIMLVASWFWTKIIPHSPQQWVSNLSLLGRRPAVPIGVPLRTGSATITDGSFFHHLNNLSGFSCRYVLVSLSLCVCVCSRALHERTAGTATLFHSLHHHHHHQHPLDLLFCSKRVRHEAGSQQHFR